MLIRTEQLHALERASRKQFDVWLRQHVYRHYWPHPVSAIGDAALGGVLAAAVARAEGFGLRSSSALVRYVNLVMELGPGFADDPSLLWAGAILRSTTLDEMGKVIALRQMVRVTPPSALPAAWSRRAP